MNISPPRNLQMSQSETYEVYKGRMVEKGSLERKPAEKTVIPPSQETLSNWDQKTIKYSYNLMSSNSPRKNELFGEETKKKVISINPTFTNPLLGILSPNNQMGSPLLTTGNSMLQNMEKHSIQNKDSNKGPFN